MYDLSAYIAARERAVFEENKRFNSERDILLSVAPDCWKELKRQFTEECVKLSSRSHAHQFECVEPDEDGFGIDRVRSGTRRIFTMHLNRIVPRIEYEIIGSKIPNRILGFCLDGTRAYLCEGRSGVVMPEFVMGILMQLTKR